MCTQITRGAREQPALRPVKTPLVAAEPHPDRLGVCGPETSAQSGLRVSLLRPQVQTASVQGCARVWLVFIISRLSGLLLNSLISQIVSEEFLNVREKYSLHSARLALIGPYCGLRSQLRSSSAVAAVFLVV